MKNKNGIIVIEFNECDDLKRSWSARNKKEFIKKALKRFKIDDSTPEYSYDECSDLLCSKTNHVFIHYNTSLMACWMNGYYDLAVKEAIKLGWVVRDEEPKKDDSEEKIKRYQLSSIKLFVKNILNKNYSYDECIQLISIFLISLVSVLFVFLFFLIKRG